MKLTILSEDGAIQALANKYGEWIKNGYEDRQSRLDALLSNASTQIREKVKSLIKHRFKE